MVEIKTFVVGALETNCYLVYEAELKSGFLIDPGTFDKRIKATIEKNGIRVKNTINTHGHADHTMGNGKFGYPVLIHELDSEFLANPMKNLAGLLKDKDRIEEDGMAFEVIHTPGHTPGSISLKLGNRIFSGDTLFREGVGRTDFPYGSENDLLSSVKGRLMIFGDDVEVLPGHGPKTTIGYERKNNPFLGGKG
jgi:glyoxylase-like metal-dependent hydrolase (beta-lactamase superfamily II)